MADWDEIKRLAADFQKVQLSSTVQSLSERNCVEIVSLLIKKKLVDLIFTSDGKEYLTPSKLIEDIKAELYVNGGRIHLADLSKTLGVDVTHIATHSQDIVRTHKDIHLILGQLIDNDYIFKIASEINEKLQQNGQINISDLTIQYDLPAEFLQQQVVERNLGKLIQGKQDDEDHRIFFTESFIARSKAKIRGGLSGLTKPTPITAILNQIEVSEKIFFSLFSQVCGFGTLTSRLTGAQYIPNVYSRSQNEWITSFFKQNGYLEFDTLRQLGISDHKTYVKKQLSNETIHVLNSTIISKRILDRLEADLDECISSKSYLDLQNNLPSVFNREDISSILKILISGHRQQQIVVVDDYVLSRQFVENLEKSCEDVVIEKAKRLVEQGVYQKFQAEQQVATLRQKSSGTESDVTDQKGDHRREERRKKAAGGKAGGGTQGRETKTKSVKKLYRTGKVEMESDEVVAERKPALTVVTTDDIKDCIREQLEEEGLDELSDRLAEYLQPELNERGLNASETLYRATVSDGSNRRQTHNDLQSKLNLLLTDVRLFEKGIKLLPNDLQGQLYKYLLKSLCGDVVNEILNYLAAEEGSTANAETLNNEQKIKLINTLRVENKSTLVALTRSLNSTNLDEFNSTVEEGLAVCSMILKKVDKKKDRTAVLNHRHKLLEQLQSCEDPAVVLHLTVLIIFTTATQCMVHASGKHVAGIIAFLKDYLTKEQAEQLLQFHGLVSSLLIGGTDADEVKYQLKDEIPKLKRLAEEYKRQKTNE